MSSAPTSRFSRILRSASFRMTLAYVGLFVVSAGVLFATVYFTATAAMQSDMQAVLRSEAYQLGEIHRRSGLLGVAQEITKRINFRTRGPIYYLLQGPSQQVMVGNLPGMPPVNGAIDFAREDNAAPTSERARLMGFGLTLPDGSFILVAQDTSRLLDMQRAIESAFAWAGGRIRPREPGRYEITAVPRELRDRDRVGGRGLPVGRTYERVTFDRELAKIPGQIDADLLAPGHPLMDALVGLVAERFGGLLREGAVLVDASDPSMDPWVLVYLEHAIADGRTDDHGIQRVVSRRVAFVRLDAEALVERVVDDVNLRRVRAEETDDVRLGQGDERRVDVEARPLDAGARREVRQRLERRHELGAAVRVTGIVQRVHANEYVICRHGLGVGKSKGQENRVSSRHVSDGNPISQIVFGNLDVCGQRGSSELTKIQSKNLMFFRAHGCGKLLGSLELDSMALPVIKGEAVAIKPARSGDGEYGSRIKSAA